MFFKLFLLRKIDWELSGLGNSDIFLSKNSLKNIITTIFNHIHGRATVPKVGVAKNIRGVTIRAREKKYIIIR